MKKRLVAFTLMLSMMISVFPVFPAKAADAVIYKLKYTPTANLLNSETAGRTTFLSKFQTNEYNSETFFGLDYDMKETKNYYFHDLVDESQLGPYISDTIDKGDMHYRIGATMKGDRHATAFSHLSKKNSSMAMSVQDLEIIGPGGDSSETVYSGTNFEHLPWYSHITKMIYIHISHVGYDCNCGSPTFDSPVINLADLNGPAIKECYYSLDPGSDTQPPAQGNYWDTYWSDVSSDNQADWKPIYINFRFSEAVRFSDHTANHSDLHLKLRLSDRATGFEVMKDYYAPIYALRGDVVTFKFDYPEDVAGAPLNHYISSFKGIMVGKGDNEKSALYQKKENGFELDLLLNGESVRRTKKGNSFKYASLNSYLTNSANGINKTTSVFTDLAGNPCVTTSLDNMANITYPAYADSLSPYIEKIEVSAYRDGKLIPETIVNGEEVNDFLKIGDKINFSVLMSEYVRGDERSSITTNIKNSAGEYIVLEKAGNYYGETMYKSFTMEITSDIKPPDETINIIDASMPSDLHGNKFGPRPMDGTAGEGRIAPAVDKALKMDLLAPLVTVQNPLNDDGRYAVIPVDSNTVRIDFVFDEGIDPETDPKHISGLIASQAIFGDFKLTSDNTGMNFGKYSYQYAITAQGSDVPQDEQFRDASVDSVISFPQISQDRKTAPHSIYLRFNQGFPLFALPLSVELKTKDFAGYETKMSFGIEKEAFYTMLDRKGPGINVSNTNVSYDPISGLGDIAVTFSVTDQSMVNAASVKYAFVDEGAIPSDTDWIYAALTEDAEAFVLRDIMYAGEPLGAGERKFDFYVYAEDSTTNRNSTTFGPYKISYDYRHIGHTVSSSEGTYQNHPYMKIAATGEDRGYAWVFIRPENPSLYFSGQGLFGSDEYILVNALIDQTERNIIDPNLIKSRGVYGKYNPETNTFVPMEADIESIADIFNGKYLGKVNVFYMAGMDLYWTQETGFTYSQPVYTSHGYELWYTGELSQDEKEQLGMEAIPAALEAEASWADGDALEYPDWIPGDGGAGSHATLAGRLLQVDITAALEPDFGLDILDTEASYIRLLDDTGKELYLEKITKGSMRVVIPDGIEYSKGKHKVHLELYVKTTYGTEINKTYDEAEIYVDPGELSDFGLSALITELHNDSGKGIPSAMGTSGTERFEYTNTETAEDMYQRPSRLILNSHRSANGVYHTHALAFTERASDQNDEYIQVSNVTSGSTHEGVWHNDPISSISEVDGSTYYRVIVYDSIEELNAAQHGESEIPVVADIDNIISYRMVRENGKQSPIYTMTIFPDTTMEETVIDIEPLAEGPLSKDFRGVITGMPVGAKLYQYVYDEETSRTEWVEIKGSAVEVFENGYINNYTEEFYVVDMEGNIDYFTLTPPNNLWQFSPRADTEINMVSPNVAELRIDTIHSGKEVSYLADYGMKLHVAFDEAYSNRIGTSKVTYDIPPISEWNTDTPDGYHHYDIDDAKKHTGIYSFSLSSELDNQRVVINELMMLHKYDSSLAEGAEETVTLTITVEDIAGNISAPSVTEIKFKNIEPKIIGVERDEDVLLKEVSENRRFTVPNLIATVPIAEAYPGTYTGDTETEPVYMNGEIYWSKPFVNVYRDGQFTLSFLDMFGNTYRQAMKLESTLYTGDLTGEIYDLGMDLQFSDPDPETGTVTLNYMSVDERIIVDISQVTGELPLSFVPMQSSEGHEILARRTNAAEVVLDPQLPILIMMYDPDQLSENNRLAYMGTFAGSRAHILIPDFVRRPIDASVEWHFNEFGTSYVPEQFDEEGNSFVPSVTNQNVTAYLVTDRYVNGLNGKGTYYTFTYGGQTEYTFEYEDLSGIKGELSVSLSDIPITITEPVVNTADTEPPEYSLNIYGKYNSVFENVNMYTPGDVQGTPSAAVKAISWVQGYMLSFRVQDNSSTKLVILNSGEDISSLTYESAESRIIDGISADGNLVTVSKPSNSEQPESFDVVIIDTSNNMTVISFNSEDFMIDNDAPYIENVEFVQTNLYEKTAYVLLADEDTNSDYIRWIYPASARKVTEGQFIGRYALVFDTNKTVNVRFADELGNEGSDNITVDDIDSSKPNIINITWTPGNLRDSSQPPKQTINTSVTALVEFDKQISKINFKDKYNEYADNYIDVVLQNNQAVITFEESNFAEDPETLEWTDVPWEITLEFTAVNGAVGEEALPVLLPVIDKTPPQVYTGYQENGGEPKVPFVDIVFEVFTEDCYMLGTGSKLYKPGETITKRITENGKHTFVFTDLAGNQARQEVEVNCIDAEAPLILLKDLPDKDFSTKENIKIKATLNEEGYITIDGERKYISAPNDINRDGVFSDNECSWAEFTITKNGGYIIEAEDSIGLITQTYISVNCIDTAAPSLTFSPSVFTIVEGTPKADLIERLNSGIMVWDNVSKAEDIAVAFDDFDEALLSQVGVHPVSYTAVDKAGNATNGTRYLKVYSASEPQVTLNGIKTFKNEITLLGSEEITVSVSNLSDGEPYTVYVRKGRWTEAQMKTKSEILTEMTFTAEKEKYYTLYIVTQSRNSYVTNFFVQ